MMMMVSMLMMMMMIMMTDANNEEDDDGDDDSSTTLQIPLYLECVGCAYAPFGDPLGHILVRCCPKRTSVRQGGPKVPLRRPRYKIVKIL